MKKTALCVMLMIAAMALTGCDAVLTTLNDGGSEVFYQNALNQSLEDENYNRLVDKFFIAVDARDAEGVKELFADKVVERYTEMDAQLAALFETYKGPTQINTRDGVSYGDYETNDGMRSSEVEATFVVMSGGEYFWCEMRYMYENSDPDMIGITSVNFYTAADYCRVWYREDMGYRDNFGLKVYADTDEDSEIRCICGQPYRYAEPDMPLDIDAAQKFLDENNSYPEFVARFGEPCAQNPVAFDYIYRLPDEYSRPRYLMLSANLNDDTIFGAKIVDDLNQLSNVRVFGE